MPPNFRKRVKKIPVSSSDYESQSKPEMGLCTDNSKPKSSKRVPAGLNSRGFPSLPYELLSGIIKYFPTINLGENDVPVILDGCYGGSSDWRYRQMALRSLSQTCRYLRSFCLPLLWERFDICLFSKPMGVWYRELGQVMAQKTQGMLKSRHLWPHVRIVTVTFTRYQTTTLLPPFVKLLQSLSNVHTLHIPHAHSAMTSVLKENFRGCEFPSIRAVVLPNCAHEVLRCCPQTREVTCNGDDGQKLASALVNAGCSKLEVIRHIQLGSMTLKRFIKSNPPLRCVRMSISNYQSKEEDIKSFSSFSSLRIIEIEKYGGVSQQCVQAAKQALRDCMEYKAPAKPKNSRGKHSNRQDEQVNLVDLYTDARIVRTIQHYGDGRPAITKDFLL